MEKEKEIQVPYPAQVFWCYGEQSQKKKKKKVPLRRLDRPIGTSSPEQRIYIEEVWQKF